MVVTTLTSLVILLGRYVQFENWSLVITDVVLLVLGGGVVAMTFKYFYNLRSRMVSMGGTD